MKKAMFGAGCFWGVEEAFSKVDGVLSTTVGYSGGDKPNPTYRQVCAGDTGHAEVVLVEYDPERTSYESLLNVFWENHDPTQVNRQGPDIGDQYRTAIFYFDEEQKKIAEKIKKSLDTSGKFKKPIATQITPAEDFYRAEEYHQKYFEKNKPI